MSTVPGRFNGRRALVTGGAGAVGSAVAGRLAAEGATIVIWDRDAAASERCVGAVRERGGDARFAVLDVTDAAAVSAESERLVGDGGVDILVNVAGGGLDKAYSLLDQSDTDWRETFELNVVSMARVTRLLAGPMKARGYGRIVNVGSKAGRFGSFVDGPSYVAAKGAVHAMTLCIAMELGRDGVTCNAVAPSMILIERVRALWESRRPLEEREAFRKSIPLQRFGTAEDVAGAIAFLASDDAAFITGTILDINGGQSICT